jgi:hypothetical protein
MLCLELFVVRILHAVHLSGRVRVCQSAVPHVDTGGAVTERSSLSDVWTDRKTPC